MVNQHPISTMRRLNNYMRCTMGESRLPSLALMHIKYDLPVDLEDLSQRTLSNGPDKKERTKTQ